MPGYECNLCDAHETATLLITPLTGGDTLAFGQECAPVGLAAILASMVGVDADGLYDAIRKHADREHKAADAAANGEPDKPARAGRGRPRAAHAAQDGSRTEAGE